MREQVWDAAKGIAIIAVVVIHVSSHALTLDQQSSGFWFGIALRQFVNFAVPSFLALAGYFAGRKPVGSAMPYIQSRAMRLLPAYVLWTVIYILVLRRGHLTSPVKLAEDFIMGTGIGIGYFVIVLFQMVLLTPLLDRIRRVGSHLLIIAALTSLGLAYSYVLRFAFQESELADFPAAALPFFVWYPFYHLGFLVSRMKATGRFKSLKIFSALWASTIIFSFVEAWLLVRAGQAGFAASQLKLSSFAASLSLLLALLALSTKKPQAGGQFLPWLGSHSYPVYLTHLLVLAVLREPLLRRGLSEQAFMLVLTVATLGICATGVYVATKVLPDRARLLVLGS